MGGGCLSRAAWPQSPDPCDISSISLVLVTRRLQGDWWVFSKTERALFSVLSHKEIQDEILAAGNERLKEKTVFHKYQ